MKNLSRFQFKKGETSDACLMTLEDYSRIMTAFPYKVDPKAYTLWIPKYSSNRSACVNLNHGVNGFDEDGFLWGENGNCSTPYMIILVSPSWNKEKVELLGKKLVEKYGLTQHDQCPVRAIKADRINEIVDLIINDKELH